DVVGRMLQRVLDPEGGGSCPPEVAVAMKNRRLRKLQGDSVGGAIRRAVVHDDHAANPKTSISPRAEEPQGRVATIVDGNHSKDGGYLTWLGHPPASTAVW